MERMPRKIALIGLGVLPVFAVPGMGFRDVWEAACVYGACIAVMFRLGSWWFRIFLAAAVMALLRHPTMDALYATAMIIIFLGAGTLFMDARESGVISCIRIPCMVMAGVVLLQWAHILPVFFNRPCGFFNPDAAGVFFALCLPAFFSGKARYLTPLIVICIFLSRTTTGFAATIAGFAVFAAILHPGLLVYAAAPVMAVCAIWGVFIDPFAKTLSCHRWMVWKQVLLTFRSEYLGRGLGSFKHTFGNFIAAHPVLHKKYYACAHNEYLQAGYEMGIQTVMVVAAFLAVYGVRTIRNRDRMTTSHAQAAAGVAVVAVSCMGWFTLHIAPLALVSMAWIAMWIKGFDRIDPETEVV
jgi:hypothetical protein